MAGVGKSAIGILVAEALGFNFIDVDHYITEEEGKPLQEIIDDEGEEVFLQLEKQRMCAIDLIRKVVVPGGSIIYHPDFIEYLKQYSTLVYLDDSFENIEQRLTSVSTRGIVGLKSKSLRQIYNERRPLYSKHADITINCQGKSEDQLAQEILHYYLDLRK